MIDMLSNTKVLRQKDMTSRYMASQQMARLGDFVHWFEPCLTSRAFEIVDFGAFCVVDFLIFAPKNRFAQQGSPFH